MDGILFVLRTGTPWRDLPERYGPYTTCFNRYNRWSGNGLREKIMSKLQELAEGDDNDNDGDGGGSGELRLRLVDSSSIRVRRHGAGAPRDGEPPEVGMSRGGRTTKVRTGIDGNALVKAVLQAPGQAADCTQVGALLEGLGPDETVIGDRDCDSNAILDMIVEAGATAVIPPKSSRNEQRGLDREACRERRPVERIIGRIKEFRRVAARYDKTARNFLSTVRLAISRFLLRRVAGRLIESTA